jgi:capsular polysaccharide biosynthesis protein
MLNPDQVRRWRAGVASNPELRRAFDGHHLGEVELDIPREPVARDGKRIAIGSFYPPAAIIGEPFDRACMDGIGTFPIHALPIASGTYRDARVVGASALLTAEGVLLAPGDVRHWGRAQFVGHRSIGHQGFLVEDSGERVVLRFVARPTPRVLAMDALFLHNLEPGNFGSFMFRQLPQMLAARATERSFDCYITADRVPWFLEALALLGFPPRPVFTVREVTGEIFRSVTLYDGFDVEGFLRPETRRSLADLTGKLPPARGRARRKIYVSRLLSGLARPWYRAMQNEHEVEQRMQRRGFEIIHPETLSLKAQARVFSTASHVVGPSGSGMFNVMFAHETLRVVDIETFHVTVRQHAKLYASLGAEYAFLFAPMDSEDMRAPEHRKWTLPLDLLDQALDWALSGDTAAD